MVTSGQERVVLVTGASRRVAIGAAIARRLVADGACVMLHSWSPHDQEQSWEPDPGGPDALVAELRAAGGRVEHIAADLADPDAPARLVHATRRAFGHLDGLVANHARSSQQSLEQLTAQELDLSYAVNTRATLLLVQAFAAPHEKPRGGRVLLFTSGQYHGAMPDELPYIASKAALHELTRSLAVHLAPRGSPSTASTQDRTTPATPTRPPTRRSQHAAPADAGAAPPTQPSWSPGSSAMRPTG